MAEDRSYNEVLGDIAGGARHTANDWPEWFAEASGDFEARVGKVFEEYGIMPTPSQFKEAQESPLPKATKKAAKDDEGE